MTCEKMKYKKNVPVAYRKGVVSKEHFYYKKKQQQTIPLNENHVLLSHARMIYLANIFYHA